MKNETAMPPAETEKWLTVAISLAPQNLERLSGELFALGCQGVHERETDFVAYFSAKDWNSDKQIWMVDLCRKIKPDLRISDLVIEGLPDRDWNAPWREYFKTFHVNEQLVIAPAWEAHKAKPGEQVITINPQMAFGTGHHETTQLVLLFMQKYFRQEMTLLDAGTGSAILAIYGAQLGAKLVFAFDNDPVAMDNAAENLRLNHVAARIELRCCAPEALAQEKYDCITANINRNILLQYPKLFRQFSKNQGLLILSGILYSDYEDITTAYEAAGWILQDQMRRNEWLGLVFINRGQALTAQPG